MIIRLTLTAQFFSLDRRRRWDISSTGNDGKVCGGLAVNR
jgi:hypothetical protein